MHVARVAIFNEPSGVQDDDDRRASSLRDLVRGLPGFVAGYHLRDEASGRLMSITIWASMDDLESGEEAVRARPPSDQRGIEPSVVERWTVDGVF